MSRRRLAYFMFGAIPVTVPLAVNLLGTLASVAAMLAPLTR
jgi:hypothetical protein